MAERIILRNPQKFDVGIITQDRPLGVNIKARSFAQVTEDDINYIASTSNLFQKGILHVDKEYLTILQGNGIDPENDPNYISDAEIQKKLSGTVKKMEEWLESIGEGYILDRIFDIAKEMNLSVNKIKVLQEKMPNRDFFD